MSTLFKLIAKEIADHPRRSISFARYMELALYHPEHGYYAGSGRVGWRGDFYTSVSVGSLFGRLLGKQIEQMWELLGRPASFAIIEQGANDGCLAADILEWAENAVPEFYGALRYNVVEPLESVRRVQGERLAAWEEKLCWLESLDDLDAPFERGVFLSNELVDAFPVRQVVARGAGDFAEKRVAHQDGRLAWCEAAIKTSEREESEGWWDDARSAYPDLPEGMVFEVRPGVGEWLASVARSIANGWVVTIDYGRPRRELLSPAYADGTVQTYSAHRKGADPLAQPGECDITAHVDFTQLAEAGEACGLVPVGFVDQNHFLMGIAEDEFRDGVVLAPRDQRAFMTLTHPEMMGTSFRVLVQATESCRENSPELAGLRHRNRVQNVLGPCAK